MTVLSVNINKIALIRNSRGGNNPNVLQVALDCERFGAQGITIHPRPDERHARYNDVYELKSSISTELNIEGYPSRKFLEVVCDAKPAQVTLVPDLPGAITSDSGWNTVKELEFLKKVTSQLQNEGIRVSIFVDPIETMIESAAKIGCERIELYTESYARNYLKGKENAIDSYVKSSKLAHELGLQINAGHDLSLENLSYFKQTLPYLHEVSIGHALVCDALYLGLEKTIQLYRKALE